MTEMEEEERKLLESFMLHEAETRRNQDGDNPNNEAVQDNQAVGQEENQQEEDYQQRSDNEEEHLQIPESEVIEPADKDPLEGTFGLPLPKRKQQAAEQENRIVEQHS